MDTIDTIWSFVQQLMLERNTDLPENELKQKIELVKSNARFITGLSVTPQKFNVSVEGQAIGLHLFYDPLLLCWKCNMTDANEDNILTDITLMAGVNACQGLQLKYHATDDNNEVIEEDLVIRGLFVTEPRGQRFDKYERGIESSKFAFTSDSIGNPACAIVYFTSEEIADTYNSLINGERQFLQVDLDDMDYTIEVK